MTPNKTVKTDTASNNKHVLISEALSVIMKLTEGHQVELWKELSDDGIIKKVGGT